MVTSHASRPAGHRSLRPPWVIVAGGFHRHGGMDRANAALAEYLVERETPVHLVAHRVDPSLAIDPMVTVHLARKPSGSVVLGEPYLDRVGRVVAARVSGESRGTRVLVNGGNCSWPDVNWAHCVHHAWARHDASAPVWFKAKSRIAKSLACRREARSFRSARIIVANSERTRHDLISHLGIDPERIHTAYPGADPQWTPASSEERAQARAWLGNDLTRPLVAFVGALGHDSNKGFDALWSAWTALCGRSDWDANLVVAGGGLGNAEWQRKVAQSRYADRALMLGFTDRVGDLLAAADLLVSPVRYEAYGLNVQEAICRGVPAMVSARAGIAERYPASLRDLLISDPDNAERLAAMLVRWRSEIDAWRERITPLARELSAHTWRHMAEQIASIVEAA